MFGFLHKQVRYFLVSVRKKFSERQFLLLACVIVGLSSGSAAIILKLFAFHIHRLIDEKTQGGIWTFLYVLLPSIGIFFTVWFINKILKGNFLKGNDKIIYAIAKKSSILPFSQIYSHVITSALTVGSGGSAGLESPIVATGAAIGSNFARTYYLSYKERTLLLACGVAGGIAAAFNAPIAGVLFALEVFLIDVSINAFIPLIIAAASGALLSKIILKEGILLYFKLEQPFNYNNVPFYIILGLLAGAVSLYYAKVFTFLDHKLLAIKLKYKRALIGSLLLAVLILFFPSLFGEGYTSISSLANMRPELIFQKSIIRDVFANEWMIFIGVTLVMFFKVFAAAFTIGGGGNGGNFAPSLFVGAYLGFAFSGLLHLLYVHNIPDSNYTIVAMAGVLSGVVYAPLTGIFLIAEITGGYELMIPLMIVSAISYMIVKAFEPVSMEMKNLLLHRNVHVHNKDKFLLNRLEISELIEMDYDSLDANQQLPAISTIIAQSKRNTFPVVDKKGKLLGIIKLINIKSILFQPEQNRKIYAKELMEKPPAVIELTEDLNSIMDKFDTTGVDQLPIVDKEIYIGFMSKTMLLTRYRKEILDSF
jgi:CIC family chloride channel protein